MAEDIGVPPSYCKYSLELWLAVEGIPSFVSHDQNIAALDKFILTMQDKTANHHTWKMEEKMMSSYLGYFQKCHFPVIACGTVCQNFADESFLYAKINKNKQ